MREKDYFQAIKFITPWCLSFPAIVTDLQAAANAVADTEDRIGVAAASLSASVSRGSNYHDDEDENEDGEGYSDDSHDEQNDVDGEGTRRDKCIDKQQHEYESEEQQSEHQEEDERESSSKEDGEFPAIQLPRRSQFGSEGLFRATMAGDSGAVRRALRHGASLLEIDNHG